MRGKGGQASALSFRCTFHPIYLLLLLLLITQIQGGTGLRLCLLRVAVTATRCQAARLSNRRGVLVGQLINNGHVVDATLDASAVTTRGLGRDVDQRRCGCCRIHRRGTGAVTTKRGLWIAGMIGGTPRADGARIARGPVGVWGWIGGTPSADTAWAWVAGAAGRA